MIFREIEIKGAGGCYKLNVTELFFKSLPDWSDLKRVCPYNPCGSSNPLCKSHMWLYTLYWGSNLINILNFHEIHRFREIPLSLSLLFRARRSMSISRSKIINFTPISLRLAKETVSIHENFIFKGNICLCDH